MAGATNTTLGTIKLAGDFIGGHAEAPALRPSGVKADTYNITDKVYVDAQGRITWAKQLPEDFAWPEGSKTEQGIVQIGLLPDPNNKSIDVTEEGVISVNLATNTDSGIAKLGNNLTKNGSSGATDVVIPNATTSTYGLAKPDNSTMLIDGNGAISISATALATAIGPATSSHAGLVKEDTNFLINNGVLDFHLVAATANYLGVVKPSTGFTLTDNKINLTIGSSTTQGGVSVPNNVLYTDPATGAVSTHWVYSGGDYPYGIVAGVSGGNIALDDSTHTLSATYSFNDFSGDATSSVLGKVQVGDYIDVDANGVISLPNATSTIPGVFKVTGRSFKTDSNGRLYWDTNYWPTTDFVGHVRPDNVTIKFEDASVGKISYSASDLPNATGTNKGVVQVGSGFNLSTNTISVPVATTSTLGTVKPGTFMTVTNGELSLNLNTLATSNSLGLVKPTTYGDSHNQFNIDNGVLSLPIATRFSYGVVQPAATDFTVTNYTIDIILPKATDSLYGGVVGDNVTTFTSNGDLTLSVPKATATSTGFVKTGLTGIEYHGETLYLDSTLSKLYWIYDNVRVYINIPAYMMRVVDGELNPPIAQIAGTVGKPTYPPGVVATNNTAAGIKVDADGIMDIAPADEIRYGVTAPHPDYFTISSDSTLNIIPAGNTLLSPTANNYVEHGTFTQVNKYTNISDLPKSTTTGLTSNYDYYKINTSADGFNASYHFIDIAEYSDDDMHIFFSNTFNSLANVGDFINQKLFLAIRVANKTGTSTPVNYKFHSGSNTSYTVLNGAAVAGDIIMCEIINTSVSGNILKSSHILS